MNCSNLIRLVQGAIAGSSLAVEDSEMAEWIRQQIAILKQKVQETGLELDRCRQDQVRQLSKLQVFVSSQLSKSSQATFY